MNLTRKGHGHSHRGIIGVESAIVLIAFVIVAAALAFVALNMGFSTTQKAKTTIIAGLNEASSGLEVSGKVVGLAQSGVATPRLNATAVPIKVASGGDPVNLDPALTQIAYLSNSVQFDDIYIGSFVDETHDSFRNALADAQNPMTGDCWAGTGDYPVTEGTIYWSEASQTPPNLILESGEHAVIAICFEAGGTEQRPAALDTIRVEVIVATGASLTVERQVPAGMSTAIVDLG